MRLEDIEGWLLKSSSAIEIAREIQVKSTKQRAYEPLSPPASLAARRKRSLPMPNNPSQTPNSKRQRTDDSGTDDAGSEEFDTPRAGSSRVVHQQGPLFQSGTSTASLPPPPASQGTSISRASGCSSPTKQLMAMELDPDGIEKRILSLSDRTLPKVLRQMLLEISKASNGFHILSRTLEDKINLLKRQDEFGEFSEVEDFAYVDAQIRDAHGPTPTLEDVETLVDEAKECQRTLQDEAGWNIMVHHPLLFKAMNGRRRRGQRIGTAPCITAKIIKEYLPVKSQPKMVDFCMFICPESDPQSDIIVEAVRQKRLIMPQYAINHTDYPAFRNRPITVSIETKRQGGTGKEDAELQIGTWHAAQWKFLQAHSRSLDGLDFLPAVVVRGHEWSFVATTREENKTILWLEKPFGSTASSLGAYKIIWTLQRLAKWSDEVYWPWYKKNLLGLDLAA